MLFFFNIFQRWPLLLYLHHDSSILTNVFCRWGFQFLTSIQTAYITSPPPPVFMMSLFVEYVCKCVFFIYLVKYYATKISCHTLVKISYAGRGICHMIQIKLCKYLIYITYCKVQSNMIWWLTRLGSFAMTMSVVRKIKLKRKKN